MPKISIITPCYNGFKYMDNYWKSLENQTFEDFEVIIVDDSSNDDSYDKLCAYRSSSSLSIKVLRNERNSGPGKSRQLGLESARGVWVAFCDCDDWYEFDFMEKMIQKAERLSSDLVMCNFNYAFPDGSKKRLEGMDVFTESSTSRDYLAYSTMTLCRMLIKRELFNDVLMPGLYHCEDGAVAPQLLVKAKKVAVTREALYNYFMRNGSLSNAVSPSAYRGFLEAYDIVYDRIAGEYHLECEFIGIKMVCYGATLNAFKAGVKTSVIKDFVSDFYERHLSGQTIHILFPLEEVRGYTWHSSTG